MSRFRPLLAALGFGLVVTTALPAQACQLICMVTKKLYKGDYMTSGGKTATQKCAEEYPGFTFAQSRSILANLPNPPTSASGTAIIGYGYNPMNATYGYVKNFVDTFGSVGSSNSGPVPSTPIVLDAGSGAGSLLAGAWVNAPTGSNCNNGTALSHGVSGTLSDGSTGSAARCGDPRPLLCCNVKTP